MSAWTAALAAVLLVLGLTVRAPAALADPSDEEAADARTDPEYTAGKAALDRKEWRDAIRLLSSVALRDTRNADVQNYLGYAYRNLGQLEPAFRHYRRALELNPRHRGAHEYIGEAYLLMNDLAGAEKHLAALEKICLIPCEEYDDLKEAVAAHRRRTAR